MTKKTLTLISITTLVVGLLIGSTVGCGEEEAAPKEVTEQGPMTLPELAEAIEEGEIDVGTEYGLASDERYHKIHATVLGLECTTCHISEPDTTQIVFTAQDVSPQAPGPVDKRACLGCHRAGPGDNIYGSGGS